MGGGALWARGVVVDHQVARKGDDLEALTPHSRRSQHMAERVTAIDVIGGRRITYLLQIVTTHDYRVQSSYKNCIRTQKTLKNGTVLAFDEVKP